MANRTKQPPAPANSKGKLQVQPSNLEQSLQDLREAFDLFDPEGTGVIDLNQFKSAMNSLGFDTSNQAINQILSEIDQDGSGSVDFDEFMSLMRGPLDREETRLDFNKGFELFDEEGKGFITLENLRRAANELGEKISDEVLMEMMKVADQSGAGKVDIEDYYNIMTRKGFT